MKRSRSRTEGGYQNKVVVSRSQSCDPRAWQQEVNLREEANFEKAVD